MEATKTDRACVPEKAPSLVEDAALWASEMRYRRLFETAQDGILLLDAATGQITDVNPFLVKMLGYSHAEFVGKHLWEIGPFKDVAETELAFEQLQRDEYIRYEDLPLETRDGQRVAVEFVSNVYQVNGHQVIQCNVRDITERKRAEEALRQSEEKFSKAFQTAPYAITITRADDGRFIEVNDTFISMTGFTRAEALADSSIGLNLWVNVEDRQGTVAALRAGQAVVGRECLFQTKNGTIITGWFSAQTIHLSHGPCILSSIQRPYRAQARGGGAARERGAVPRLLRE